MTGEFELSAGNVIIGTFTFAFVSLPDGWVVRKGSPPDIEFTTKLGNLGWVLEGSGSFYAVNVVTGQIVEIDVSCKKKRNPSLRGGEPTIRVSGHEASWSTGHEKAGLIRRRELEVLRVTVPCDVTGRLVKISFSGQRDGIGSMEKLVGLVRCH